MVQGTLTVNLFSTAYCTWFLSRRSDTVSVAFSKDRRCFATKSDFKIIVRSASTNSFTEPATYLLVSTTLQTAYSSGSWTAGGVVTGCCGQASWTAGSVCAICCAQREGDAIKNNGSRSALEKCEFTLNKSSARAVWRHHRAIRNCVRAANSWSVGLPEKSFPSIPLVPVCALIKHVATEAARCASPRAFRL